MAHPDDCNCDSCAAWDLIDTYAAVADAMDAAADED